MKVDPDTTLIVGAGRNDEENSYLIQCKIPMFSSFLHHCYGGLGVRVEGSRL